MSKYTTQVRWICETTAKRINPDLDLDTATPTEIISTAAPGIFNFDFPIYDEKYRLPLEVKILRHFYKREIGEETVGLWKLDLEDRLNIVMPWYNALYKTTLYEFNPLYDVDYTKEGHRNGRRDDEKAINEQVINNISKDKSENKTTQISGIENASANRTNEDLGTIAKQDANTSNASSNENKTDLYSDTPQGSLEIFGIESPSQPTVEGNSWLTNAERISNNMSGQSSGTASSNTSSHDQSTENSQSALNRNESGNATLQGNETQEGSTNRTKNDVGNITTLDDYIETVRGKMSTISYSKLIKEFRENIVNIDKMIINELDDLFFGLWN